MHWHILSLITEASPLKNQLTGTAGLLSAPCSCGSHKAQRCLSCKTPLQPLTTFCDGLSLASLLQPPASLPMLLRAATPRSPATTLCQLLVVLSQASFSELQTPPPRREQMTPYFPWHHLLSQAALGAQAGWHSTRQLRLQQGPCPPAPSVCWALDEGFGGTSGCREHAVFFMILKFSVFACAAPCLYSDLWEATQNYLGLSP